MEEFEHHFRNQRGGSAEDNIGPAFRSGFVNQRGRGVIGNFFKSLWSHVTPLFKSAAQTFGKEALNTGSQILSDATRVNNMQDFRDAAAQRMKESRDRFAQKLRGGGRKKKRKVVAKRSKKGRKRTASIKRLKRVKKHRKKTRSKADIFNSV